MTKAPQKPEVPKCYIIKMMGDDDLKVDRDELGKVARAIQTGRPCWVRQGNFNPKSYSAIVLDLDRMQEYRIKLNEVQKHNQHEMKYVDPENRSFKRYPEFEQLNNIFEGVDVKGQMKRLDAGEGRKQIDSA